MRKFTAIILGFSALCTLPRASFAEDRAQLAEKLLEVAFACPIPMNKLGEGNVPDIQVLEKSSFQGDKTKFRVTEDSRQLEIRDGNRPPLETLRRFTTIARYADLEPVKIDEKRQNPVLSCKAEQRCIDFVMNVIKGTDDTGSVVDSMTDSVTFGFCDDETLHNVASAFDALIASPPSSLSR
jgi:hypothetical protein